MVLVHGGGGTAFAEWVRLWNNAGYAAIAMDTCGSTAGGEHANRPRHALGGPPGWGGFDQIDEPFEDMWAYHATQAVIRANSLLRSMPEIDPKRIGLTGISWGGVLACMVAGLDPRFAGVCPVYGTGYLQGLLNWESDFKKLSAEQLNRWSRLCDPLSYLPHARVPMLWVTGTNDFAFSMQALQRSYRLPLGPRELVVRTDMKHGHEEGWAPREILAWADGWSGRGPGLAKIQRQGRDSRTLWLQYAPASGTTITQAALCWTTDTGSWVDRKWQVVAADIDPASNRVQATLPENTAMAYLNITDSRGLIASSEHVGM